MALDKKTFDLDKLKISELWKFDYKDTLIVLDALEQSIIDLCSNPVKTTDNFSDYIEFAEIIKKKVDNGGFANSLKNENEKQSFSSRVRRTLTDLAIVGHINSVSSTIEKVVMAEERIITENLENVKSDFKKHRSEISKQKKAVGELKKTVEAEKAEISNIEHNTLAHVLSLMGIFSAVITMIMSAVLTSSAWLNNARASSAVVGFAIPNLVALLCIVVMLALVYLFVHRDVVVLHVEEKDANSKEETVTEEKAESKQDSHSKTLSTADGEGKIRRGYNRYKFVIFLVILLVIISVVLTFVALSVMNEINKPHERYIIPESEYRVIEEDKGDSVEKYYVFEIDGVSYRCEYDESFKNDGKLYFCKEHGVLEK